MNDNTQREMLIKLESVLKTEMPQSEEYNNIKIPTVLYDFHRSVDVLLDVADRVHTKEDFGKLSDREKADGYIASMVVEYTWGKANDRLRDDHGSMYENTFELGVHHISHIAIDYFRENPPSGNIYLADKADERLERFYQRYGNGQDATRNCPDFAHCLLQDEADERMSGGVSPRGETSHGDVAYEIRTIGPDAESFLTSVSQADKIKFIRDYMTSSGERDNTIDKEQTAEYLKNNYVASAEKVLNDPMSSIDEIKMAKAWLEKGEASQDKIDSADVRAGEARTTFIESANKILADPTSTAEQLETAVIYLEKANADPEDTESAREKTKAAFAEEAKEILSKENISGDDYATAAEYLRKGNGTPEEVDAADKNAKGKYTEEANTLMANPDRTREDVEYACELYEKAGYDDQKVNDIYTDALKTYIESANLILNDDKATSADISKAIDLLESGDADPKAVIDAKLQRCDCEIDEVFTKNGLYSAVKDENTLTFELQDEKGHNTENIRGHLSTIDESFWKEHPEIDKDQVLQKIDELLNERDSLVKDKEDLDKPTEEITLNDEEKAREDDKIEGKPADNESGPVDAKKDTVTGGSGEKTNNAEETKDTTDRETVRETKEDRDVITPDELSKAVDRFKGEAYNAYSDLLINAENKDRFDGTASEYAVAVESIDIAKVREIYSKVSNGSPLPEALEKAIDDIENNKTLHDFKPGEINEKDILDAADDHVALIKDKEIENNIRANLGDEEADKYRELMTDLASAIILGDKETITRCCTDAKDLIEKSAQKDVDNGVTNESRDPVERSRKPSDTDILNRMNELGKLAYIDENRNRAVLYSSHNPFLLKAQLNYCKYIDGIGKDDYKRITGHEKPKNIKIDIAITQINYIHSLSLSNIASAYAEGLYQAFSKMENADKEDLAQKIKENVVTKYNIDKVDKLLNDTTNDFASRLKDALGENRFNEFKEAIDNFKNTGDGKYMHTANNIVSRFQEATGGLEKRNRFDPRDLNQNLDILQKTIDARNAGTEIDKSIVGRGTEHGRVGKLDVFMATVNAFSNSSLTYTLGKEVFETVRDAFFEIFEESKPDIIGLIKEATGEKVEKDSNPATKDITKDHDDTEKKETNEDLSKPEGPDTEKETDPAIATDAGKEQPDTEKEPDPATDKVTEEEQPDSEKENDPVDKDTTADQPDAGDKNEDLSKPEGPDTEKETDPATTTDAGKEQPDTEKEPDPVTDKVTEKEQPDTEKENDPVDKDTTADQPDAGDKNEDLSKPEDTEKDSDPASATEKEQTDNSDTDNEKSQSALAKEELSKESPDLEKANSYLDNSGDSADKADYEKLGDLYKKDGKLEKAVDCWEKAGVDEKESKLENAHAAIAKEELSKESPDLDKVKDHLDAAGHHADAKDYIRLGDLYREDRNEDKAVECWHDQIRLKKGYAEDAKEQLNKDNPDLDKIKGNLDAADYFADKESYDKLGDLYEEKGEYEAAVDCWTKAEIDPDEDKVKSASASIGKEELAKDTPDLDKAKASLDAGRNFSDKEDYQKLGDLYKENGMNEHAIECWKSGGLEDTPKYKETAAAVDQMYSDISKAQEYDDKRYDLDLDGQPDDMEATFIKGAEAIYSMDNPTGDELSKAAEWLGYGNADSDRIEAAHEKACEAYIKEGHSLEAYKESRGIKNIDLKNQAIEMYAKDAYSDAQKDTGTYVRAARLFELLPEDRQNSAEAKDSFDKGAKQIERRDDSTLSDIRRAISWENKTDNPDPDLIESLEYRITEIENDYEAYVKSEIEAGIRDIVLPAVQNGINEGVSSIEGIYEDVKDKIESYTRKEFTKEMFADNVRLCIEEISNANEENDVSTENAPDRIERLEDALNEFAPNQYDIEIEYGGRVEVEENSDGSG